MVGIERISGIRQPAENKRADDRSKQERNIGAFEPDDVAISPEGQRLSAVGRYIKEANANDEFRAKRIEEARKNLEKGTHQVQLVLRQVAARISPYIELGAR